MDIGSRVGVRVKDIGSSIQGLQGKSKGQGIGCRGYRVNVRMQSLENEGYRVRVKDIGYRIRVINTEGYRKEEEEDKTIALSIQKHRRVDKADPCAGHYIVFNNLVKLIASTYIYTIAHKRQPNTRKNIQAYKYIHTHSYSHIITQGLQGEDKRYSDQGRSKSNGYRVQGRGKGKGYRGQQVGVIG